MGATNSIKKKKLTPNSSSEAWTNFFSFFLSFFLFVFFLIIPLLNSHPCAIQLVALRCGLAGGWYNFPDSPCTFYSFNVNLPRGCHGVLLSVLATSL